jgi:hypothetical protein
MIEKGTVLYNKSSGEEIVFDEERRGMIYAYIRDSSGIEYDSKYLMDIIKFGGWNPVVDFKDLGINSEDDDDTIDSMPD